MKKGIFIIFLLIVNFTIFYTKTYSNELKNVELKLKKDELAIIIIKLENSTSLLLKKDDNYILYILEYINDKDFYNHIELFTKNIDYILMTEEYDIKFTNKMIIDGTILIDNVRIEPNKIYYKDKSFCINHTSKCEFIYLMNEAELGDTYQAVMYNDTLPLKYVERLHDMWIDTYKVTDNNYVILIFGKNYEIINLQHEY